MAEYTEWGPELEAALAEPFPDECHKQIKKGGAEITYVAWTDYVKRLDKLVGPDGWENHVTLHDAGGRLIVVASVAILGKTHSNVGDESEEKESFGSPATNAFAQALKRACALFGLGLYLYDKGGGQRQRKPLAGTRNKKAPSGATAPDEWTEKDKQPFNLTKGQHAGKSIQDESVPTNYLIGLLGRAPTPALARKLNYEIERRKREGEGAARAERDS